MSLALILTVVFTVQINISSLHSLRTIKDEKELEEEVDKIRQDEGVYWKFALPGEYPWMVSLQQNIPSYAHICGGSLASDRLVLTACHCIVVRSDIQTGPQFYYIDTEDKLVLMGSVNNDAASTDWKVTAGISTFLAHPKCRHFVHKNRNDYKGGWDFDYGLIFLNLTLNLRNPYLSPFKVYSSRYFSTKRELMHKMINNDVCTVIGWGKRHSSYITEKPTKSESYNLTSVLEDMSDVKSYWPILTSIKVQLTDFGSCYKIMCLFDDTYCDVDHWGRSQICATSLGRLEACQGDSGGPLLCGQDNYLVGIVGWGPSCGEYKVPTMYNTIVGGWDFITPKLDGFDSSTDVPKNCNGIPRINFQDVERIIFSLTMVYHWLK